MGEESKSCVRPSLNRSLPSNEVLQNMLSLTLQSMLQAKEHCYKACYSATATEHCCRLIPPVSLYRQLSCAPRLQSMAVEAWIDNSGILCAYCLTKYICAHECEISWHRRAVPCSAKYFCAIAVPCHV